MAASGKTMTEYREQVDRTVTYMNRLHLPSTIQDRVRSWFSYNWTMHKTLGITVWNLKIVLYFQLFRDIISLLLLLMVIQDEKSSLVSLPLHMQMDIAMNVHIQTLSKVQLFQECDPSFIRDLVLKLKPVLFLPGDLVCQKVSLFFITLWLDALEYKLQMKSSNADNLRHHQGEVGKEMYIIKMGHVQVMGGENNDKVLVTLSEGSVFGEISLLAVGGGNRRMADVRYGTIIHSICVILHSILLHCYITNVTTTIDGPTPRSKGYSNLFMLSKADLNATLEDHHQAQKVLQRKAR